MTQHDKIIASKYSQKIVTVQSVFTGQLFLEERFPQLEIKILNYIKP